MSEINKTDLPKVILEVKKFNFWYNSKGADPVLRNIDLKIRPKKITAFIGPSGCGKTTLLRAFNRMHDQIHTIKWTGEILFNDNNILSPKTNVIVLRTQIGMVFQKPNPFPMSIYENIAFGLKSHGIRDKKQIDQIVKQSLIDAALWDSVQNRLNDSALSLSGGQQQRLCIARAIAMNPEILLMDEPTSALDPIATIKIEKLMKKLAKKYTIVLVTHSMQQAARISNYITFFYMGEIIEHGTTKRIFTNPRKQLTNDYINGKIG